jgi:hypothetical protein
MTAVLTVFVLTALAADIDGKWTAETPGRDGTPQQMTLTFKCDGDKVTGTVANARGEREISKGKIKGDNLSFAVVFQMQGNDITMNYKGKISGDEIKFNVTIEGMDRTFDFTAKKAQ